MVNILDHFVFFDIRICFLNKFIEIRATLYEKILMSTILPWWLELCPYLRLILWISIWHCTLHLVQTILPLLWLIRGVLQIRQILLGLKYTIEISLSFGVIHMCLTTWRSIELSFWLFIKSKVYLPLLLWSQHLSALFLDVLLIDSRWLVLSDLIWETS